MTTSKPSRHPASSAGRSPGPGALAGRVLGTTPWRRTRGGRADRPGTPAAGPVSAAAAPPGACATCCTELRGDIRPLDRSTTGCRHLQAACALRSGPRRHTATRHALVEQPAPLTAPLPAPPSPPDLDPARQPHRRTLRRIQPATYELRCDSPELDRRHGWVAFRSAPTGSTGAPASISVPRARSCASPPEPPAEIQPTRSSDPTLRAVGGVPGRLPVRYR